METTPTTPSYQYVPSPAPVPAPMPQPPPVQPPMPVQAPPPRKQQSGSAFTAVVIALVAYALLAYLMGLWPFSPSNTGGDVVGFGEHCGGNSADAAMCETGFHCEPEAGSILPFGDVGGTCVADGAAAIVSPTDTTTPTTEGWNTYTNDTLGFGIKYPVDLAVSEDACVVRLCSVKIGSLHIGTNNPGSGAVTVASGSESGTISIGGVMANYSFGQETENGDNSRLLPEWALVTTFVHGEDSYTIVYEYNGGYPQDFLAATIKPVLATFWFTR